MLTRVSSSVGSTVTAMVCTVVESHSDAVVVATVLSTLVVVVDGALTVAVVPVATTLDLKALAAAVGGRKAAMADPADAERTTGYVRGGISPLGQRTRLPTVVDETAELWDTVVVSAGRRGLSVELAPVDLVRLTGAVLADVSR